MESEYNATLHCVRSVEGRADTGLPKELGTFLPTIYGFGCISLATAVNNSISRDPFSRPTFSMSVLLETSLGDIVIDLLADAAPKLCQK